MKGLEHDVAAGVLVVDVVDMREGMMMSGKPRPKMRGHTNSCGNKRPYETWEEADKAASRGGRLRYGGMVAYQCRKCKKFHYGHSAP